MSLRLSQSASILAMVLGLTSLAIWSGCSASTDDADGGFDPTGPNPSTSGTGGNGGAGASGGAGTGGAAISVGVGGSGVGGTDACEAAEALATKKQLNIIVLLDRSGSMTTCTVSPCPPNGTRWEETVNALTAFANDPTSAGINLGIVYFPWVGSSSSAECLLDEYKEVYAFGTLPQSAPLFAESLENSAPANGTTPMSAGLEGALASATALQDSHPDEKVIVVLATDGDPVGCTTSIPAIAALAQSAYNYNGVQTYAVYIDGTLDNLDIIAAAGQTGQAFDVSMAIQEFANKMAEIQSDAIGCEITIPPPPDGKVFDKDLVNVNLTPGGETMATTLKKKKDEADCGAGAGWYYDDEQEPTKIIFCPFSCNAVSDDLEAKVSVAFGCLSDTD